MRAAHRATCVLAASLSLLTSGCAHRVRLEPFAGTWVLHDQGQALMVLTLQAHRGRLSGDLVHPSRFTEHADGRFEEVTTERKRYAVTSRIKGRDLTLLVGNKPDRDVLPVTAITPDHLSLRWANGMVPDWVFERQTSH